MYLRRRYKVLSHICEYCPTEFNPRLGRRNAKYCSRHCYCDSKQAAIVHKICPACGVGSPSRVALTGATVSAAWHVGAEFDRRPDRVNRDC